MQAQLTFRGESLLDASVSVDIAGKTHSQIFPQTEPIEGTDDLLPRLTTFHSSWKFGREETSKRQYGTAFATLDWEHLRDGVDGVLSFSRDDEIESIIITDTNFDYKGGSAIPNSLAGKLTIQEEFWYIRADEEGVEISDNRYSKEMARVLRKTPLFGIQTPMGAVPEGFYNPTKLETTATGADAYRLLQPFFVAAVYFIVKFWIDEDGLQGASPNDKLRESEPEGSLVKSKLFKGKNAARF